MSKLELDDDLEKILSRYVEDYQSRIDTEEWDELLDEIEDAISFIVINNEDEYTEDALYLRTIYDLVYDLT